MREAPRHSENALVDQMAALTRTKRSEVIKNALAVYHWFLRQAVTGARVVARTPSGEELVLETPELSRLEGQGILLGPRELGLLAKQLARASKPADAARLRERLTRGYYGIQVVPRVRRKDVPPALFAHLLDRIQERRIDAASSNGWLNGSTANPKSRLARVSSASPG